MLRWLTFRQTIDNSKSPPERLQKSRKVYEMRRSKPWTLIAILSVGAFLFALATQDSHTLFATSDRRSLPKDTQWGQCNPIVSGYDIVAGNQLPPSTLYFFGLQGASWENTIGADKKFKHKPFRKGLFAAETLADAEPVSIPTKGGFYSFELKSECLKAERVSSMVGLPSLPKFKNWYNKIAEFPPISEWKKKCFNEEGVPKSESFQFFETPDSSESDCEKVVERFWNDQQIGVVQDHLLAKSWIIRDQNCIQKINGSAKYWVEQFSSRPELWNKSCESHKSQKARAQLWFKSLNESPEALDESFKMGKPYSGRAPASVGEKIQFQVEDFAVEFDRAVERCQKSGHATELKEGFRSIAENMKTLESLDVKVELERLCP